MSGKDCDWWGEPETEWHVDWKKEFPPETREVVLPPHRADVKIRGMVFEFQRSSIDPGEVMLREEFYGAMCWVICGAEFQGNLEIRSRRDYLTFRWKSPRKSWWYAKKPLFVDLGYGWMFRICKIHHKVPCGGWGRLLRKEELVTL